MALVEPGGLDGLEGELLHEEELVLAAPLDHPLAKAERVHVGRLAGEPLVSYGEGSALRDAIRTLVPGGRIVAEANELEIVRELTARGLGVTLMPRSVAAPHGNQIAIRPLSPPLVLPVSLVWRARERPTPAAQAYRDHVLATMGRA
jgi:LysR family transcriptional regulator, transcription activator of glutamate synthase operon